MSHHRTTAKQARIFFARACAMLERVGVRQISLTPEVKAQKKVVTYKDGSPKGSYESVEARHARADYELMTIHGRLVLHVYDDWISTRFEESVDRPDCPGGRIGKWNFHYSFYRTTDESDVEEWLQSVEGRLRNVAGPRREPGADYAQPLRYQAPEPQSRAQQLATVQQRLAEAELELAAHFSWRQGDLNEEVRIVQTARDEESPVIFYSVDPWDVETLEGVIELHETIAELRRVIKRLEPLVPVVSKP